MKHTDEQQADESGLEELIDEQAVAWFTRLRADNVSRAEKAAFADWLQQSPDHQKAFDEICLLWGDTALKQALGETERTVFGQRHKPAHQRFQLPAILAVCVALAFVFRTELAVLAWSDYSTGIGHRQTVNLADGSSVMLNTDSAITVTMKQQQRTVRLLQGEAFFDVAHDASRPFIVYANHSAIHVVGTRFFVHETKYSDNVNVLSGKVQVTHKDKAEESVLLHDQDSVSVNREGLDRTHVMNARLTTSWIDGYLVFQNVALADVIEQVQRYRNGVVIFKDDSLRQFRINGRISLQDPRHILDTLEKTLSVKVTHLTDWLVIIG